MTWTVTGSWLGATTSTLTANNQAIGNLLVVEVINTQNSTVWATALSGGGATWQLAGVKFSGTTNANAAAVFLGTVTATGAGTITPTWSGTTPNAIAWAGHEFHSSVGSWLFDKQGNLDSTGTNSWPSMSPTYGVGELYFGFIFDSSNAVSGTTSGYVYNANVDAVNDGAAYNLSCPSTATFPVWGDSTQAFGIAILVAETQPLGQVIKALGNPVIPSAVPLLSRVILTTLPSVALIVITDTGSAADTLVVPLAIPVTDSGTAADAFSQVAVAMADAWYCHGYHDCQCRTDGQRQDSRN